MPRCWWTSRRTGHHEGPAQAGAQRLPVLAQARHRRQHLVSAIAKPYVPQNVFTSIDKETGRPEVDMAHKPATGKAAQFCPGLWGGKDWPYRGLQPEDRAGLHPVQRKPLQHARRQGRGARSRAVVDRRRHPGPRTSRSTRRRRSMAKSRRWTSTPASGLGGPVSELDDVGLAADAPAGGLVFGGGTNDREFRAYDAKTGEQLWHFRTNSGIIAPPSTFEVNGVQYIAVRVRLGRRRRLPAGAHERAGRMAEGRAARRRRLGIRGPEVTTS